MKKVNVVVIGGGNAGMSAVQHIAEAGATVCLVERNSSLGGRSLKTGFYARSILEETLSLALSPQLAFPEIFDQCKNRIKELSAEWESQLKSIGVQIVFGEGKPLGSRAVQVQNSEGSETIETEKIIIATGSRPNASVHLPLDGKIILSPQDFWDLEIDQAPESVMVTGNEESSYETARFFKALGSKVFWVSGSARLLPDAHVSLSEQLEEIAKKEKIKLLPGKKLESHLKNEKNVDVTLEGGVKFTTEKIFIVEDRMPESSVLELEAMGMRMGISGEILTEENLETSVSGIFAAGSVLGRESHYGLAEEEGRVAAENALGQARNLSLDMTPRIVHSSPELAWVGILADTAHHHGLRAIEGKVESIGTGLFNRGSGFCKLVCDKETQRIIGAQLACDRAGDLIHLVSLCIRKGMKPQNLAKMNCFRSSSANGLRIAALECVRKLKNTKQLS
ncbi:MAG: hypothetical protein COV66_11770 [Nitrospinae bacterium CG11_big_fil_rev_8_21_14_0_20_45_15]|nr:MAG: hypothetical protein COV66_11770 [Nitrospinae bacterium CG11_big_fil_rev_8_21_14_0_20_45_15]